MIKLIKKFQIKLTPFDATKDWEMSTNNNQDLLLLDTGSYQDPEVPIALEFIDYGPIGALPQDNFECNIALEQQPDDLVNTRLGLKTTGLFYADKDPLNNDFTYKRVVYSQVRTMFYNTYKDVTKTWGVENIDFNLGKTQRKLSDEFRLFDVPQNVYGDKMIPHSIVMHDFSSDTDFEITDDGNGNLTAGTNLFAKFQALGQHTNVFVQGSSSFCGEFFNPPIAFSRSFSESVAINVGFFGGSLNNLFYNAQEPFTMSISFLSGTTANDFIQSDTSSLIIGFLSGSLATVISVLSGSGSDSTSTNISFLFGSMTNDPPFTESSAQSFTAGFYSGSIFETTFPTTASIDTMSLTAAGFYSGSIFETTLPITTSIDTASSVFVGLEAGAIFQTTFVASSSYQFETASVVSVGLESGLITITIVTSRQTEYLSSVNVSFLSGSLV